MVGSLDTTLFFLVLFKFGKVSDGLRRLQNCGGSNPVPGVGSTSNELRNSIENQILNWRQYLPPHISDRIPQERFSSNNLLQDRSLLSGENSSNDTMQNNNVNPACTMNPKFLRTICPHDCADCGWKNQNLQNCMEMTSSNEFCSHFPTGTGRFRNEMPIEQRSKRPPWAYNHSMAPYHMFGIPNDSKSSGLDTDPNANLFKNIQLENKLAELDSLGAKPQTDYRRAVDLGSDSLIDSEMKNGSNTNNKNKDVQNVSLTNQKSKNNSYEKKYQTLANILYGQAAETLNKYHGLNKDNSNLEILPEGIQASEELPKIDARKFIKANLIRLQNEEGLDEGKQKILASGESKSNTNEQLLPSAAMSRVGMEYLLPAAPNKELASSLVDAVRIALISGTKEWCTKYYGGGKPCPSSIDENAPLSEEKHEHINAKLNDIIKNNEQSSEGKSPKKLLGRAPEMSEDSAMSAYNGNKRSSLNDNNLLVRGPLIDEREALNKTEKKASETKDGKSKNTKAKESKSRDKTELESRAKMTEMRDTQNAKNDFENKTSVSTPIAERLGTKTKKNQPGLTDKKDKLNSPSIAADSNISSTGAASTILFRELDPSVSGRKASEKVKETQKNKTKLVEDQKSTNSMNKKKPIDEKTILSGQAMQSKKTKPLALETIPLEQEENTEVSDDTVEESNESEDNSNLEQDYKKNKNGYFDYIETRSYESGVSNRNVMKETEYLAMLENDYNANDIKPKSKTQKNQKTTLVPEKLDNKKLPLNEAKDKLSDVANSKKQTEENFLSEESIDDEENENSANSQQSQPKLNQKNLNKKNGSVLASENSAKEVQKTKTSNRVKSPQQSETSTKTTKPSNNSNNLRKFSNDKPTSKGIRDRAMSNGDNLEESVEDERPNNSKNSSGEGSSNKSNDSSKKKVVKYLNSEKTKDSEKKSLSTSPLESKWN